jgi:hypothetical protein
MEISLIYGGVGPEYCYTAFAGIALEYTVEYAVVAFCLAELKGGVTILRACTFVRYPSDESDGKF